MNKKFLILTEFLIYFPAMCVSFYFCCALLYENRESSFYCKKFQNDCIWGDDKGTVGIRPRLQITSNGRFGGGGSTSGRYDLVFRSRDLYYQEIYFSSSQLK